MGGRSVLRSLRIAVVLAALLAPCAVGSSGPVATAPDNFDFTLIDRAAGPVRAVALQDRYAFVGVAHKLVVFDLLSGREPRLVSEGRALAANVDAIAVTGRYAYVAAGDAGLFIYDVESPSAPVLVGSLA